MPDAPRVALPIDRADLDEALLVLGRWGGRGRELPRYLREEIRALASGKWESNEVGVVADRLVIGPSARLLALVGNLRAQEAGAAH